MDLMQAMMMMAHVTLQLCHVPNTAHKILLPSSNVYQFITCTTQWHLSVLPCIRSLLAGCIKFYSPAMQQTAPCMTKFIHIHPLGSK